MVIKIHVIEVGHNPYNDTKMCPKTQKRSETLAIAYPFGGESPKACEPLSFWREISQSPRTLIVD
jgi:hypothetical protein